MSQPGPQQGGGFQLLTSPGPAAIAVVRVRGPLAEAFLRRHVRTRAATEPQAWAVGCIFRGELLDETASPIDDILVSVHAAAPRCDVRLHLHGSPWVVRRCTEMLTAAGLSERSEVLSTLWPADNRIEAEASALLPRMLTLRGVHWLLHQSELLSKTLRALAETSKVEAARQQCRQIAARRHIFDWFARPLRVALVGPSNAGKSTLANALADRHVSLVSRLPGTTRDWVEIPGEIDGFPVVWLDTAGLRRAADDLEAAGIRRTRQVMESADAVLLVLDASETPAGAQFLAGHTDLRPACVALNKSDLPGSDPGIRTQLPAQWRERAVPVSAARRTGIDALAARVLEGVGYDSAALAASAAFSDRQVQALEAAVRADRAQFRERILGCLEGPRSPW